MSWVSPCSDPEGGQGVRTPLPLKNHKNIGFLCNTGPDPLKNHKTAKQAFNVGPSFARQRNTIEMAFRWRANDGRLLVVFGSPTTNKNQKKKRQSWTPSEKTFWITISSSKINKGICHVWQSTKSYNMPQCLEN